MFGLFKKKAPVHTGTPDFSLLGVDMHSHLIPGIDDGSPDMETSVAYIKQMAELGYKKIITTPHIMWDLYKNEPVQIREKCSQVKEVLKQQGISVDFHAAAEYFLDEHFDQLLEQEESLLTLKDNKVLVEFSFVSMPLDLKDKLFAIQMKGYVPVLAHPERYPYFIHRKQVLHDLRDAGCLMQLNLLSLKGYYGKPIYEQAQYLLRHQMIDFIGTDLHNERHLSQILDPELSSKVEEIIRNHSILNSTLL